LSINVSIYLLDVEKLKQLPNYEDVLQSFEKHLGEEQQHKLQRIHQRKQSEFIFSRNLLCFALDEQNKANKSNWKIQERPDLPPYVKQAEVQNFQFSISHSHSFLGIAICESTENIGFDIQLCKPMRNIHKALEAAEYFCYPSEINTLSNIKGTSIQQEFSLAYTAIWSLKEAYFKALQRGIHNDQLKKVYFKESNLLEGNSHLSQMQDLENRDYQLAFYHPQPCSVEHHVMEVSNSKLKISKSTNVLNWQTFKIKD